MRALEKSKGLMSKELPDEAGREPLQNLKFMLTFVDHMSDYFLENQLSGVYLNFSDPWPKGASCQTAADISETAFRLRLGGEAGWIYRNQDGQ